MTDLGSRDSTDHDHLAPSFEQLSSLSPADPRRAVVRAELVVRHLPIADHIARRFAHRGQPHEDLLQVARVGLIHAVDRFLPEHGSSFLAFAIPTVMGEVRRYFRDSGWAVHVPRRLKELHLLITRATGTLSQRLGRAPTPTELAKELSLSTEEVCEGLLAGNAYRSVPVDQAVVAEGETLTLEDTFGEDDADLETIDDHQALRAVIRELPARERKVLMLRFFGNMTQTQIAERMNISQMHVSRLLSKTLTELRAALRRDG